MIWRHHNSPSSGLLACGQEWVMYSTHLTDKGTTAPALPRSPDTIAVGAKI